MRKRVVKRKWFLKEKRRKLASRLSLGLAILILFSSCLPLVLNTYAETISPDVASGQIVLNKTAEKTAKDDEFKITLGVNKKSVVSPGDNADIVLILDESSSMEDKIKEVKEGAKELCQKILENSNSNIRISIVKFSSPVDKGQIGRDPFYSPSINDSANIIIDFTSNLNELDAKINTLAAERVGTRNTDTRAGIYKAGEQIAKSIKNNKDAKRYVVMFTDGIANIPRKYAKKEAIKEYQNVIGMDSKLKFYSLALFTGDAKERGNTAINFLSSVQNVISKDGYAEKYYREDVKQIIGVFNDISTEIKGQISSGVIKNAVIKDVVTDEFEIIKDSYNCSGNVKKYSLKNTMVNGQEINFNLGDINSYGEVSFLIKSKDPYFGGKNIFTNKYGKIIFSDNVTGKRVEKEFNKPYVDIDFKKGSLNVENEVIDVKGNKIQSNETFSISIEGVEKNTSKYNMELKGNSSEIMNFYLKDKTTDISTNNDISLSYFEIGNFKVKELIPMNYKLEKIQIWNAGKWEDFKGDFALNKDNKDVKIKVINRLINDQYWFDRADNPNKLQMQN